MLAGFLLVALQPAALLGQTDIEVQVLWRGRPATEAVVELIPVEGEARALKPDTVLIDQLHLRFTPNILGVPAGTVAEFLNSDQIMHNVFSPERRGDAFDLGTYPTGESRFHTFGQPGSYVVLCHVHPEMAAWVVVSESRHVGATDEQGRLRWEGVEPGEYRVVGWLRRRVVHDVQVRIEPGQTALTVEMGR